MKPNTANASGWSLNTKVIVSMLILGFAVGILVIIAQTDSPLANALEANTPLIAETPEIVKIKNIFVDVDGDGNIDLILYGDVIFNKTQPNFQQSQP